MHVYIGPIPLSSWPHGTADCQPRR